MFMKKYGPAIGWEYSMTWKFRRGTYGNASFPANHSAVFIPDHWIAPRDSVDDSGWPLQFRIQQFNPPPYTLNPKSETLNPKPETLSPKTLHPEP